MKVIIKSMPKLLAVVLAVLLVAMAVGCSLADALPEVISMAGNATEPPTTEPHFSPGVPTEQPVGTASPVPATASPTIAPSASPQPAATPAATIVPTISPTQTPAPSPEPTPIPTPTPEPITAQSVTVTVPVTRINVSIARNRYAVGEQFTFTVQVLPEDATDKTFTINVSGAGTMNGSDVSGHTGGEIVITATASNGVTGSRTVEVIDLVAFAEEVFRLTNIERQNAGLQTFSQTPGLTRVAEVRAKEIIARFSHTRPDGREPWSAYAENNVSYRRAAENIAAGHNTPAAVVQGWMNSEGHRANILNSNLGHLGVGVAMDETGRLFWSQLFMD